MFQFRRFPTYTYLIQCTLTEYCSAGFPHSEICGSRLMCSSPQLIAACHVLHRLLMPRHSPCALISLTSSEWISHRSFPCQHENSLTSSLLLFLANPLTLGFARMRVDSIYIWFSIKNYAGLRFGYIVVLLPFNSYIKSPQKFVLCYLSVACSQFLACFTVQFSRCKSRRRASLFRFPSVLSDFRFVSLFFAFLSLPFFRLSPSSLPFQSDVFF